MVNLLSRRRSNSSGSLFPMIFTSVDVDVQKSVVDFAPKGDLLALARVSNHFNRLVLPAIYAHVELLLHIKFINGPYQEDDSEVLFCMQRRFRETLIAHPERALLVRSLKWEIKCPPSNYTGVYVPEAVSRLQTLLASMKYVSKFHLAVSEALPEDISWPALLPHVRSVKLAYATPIDLVKSIVQNPTAITELSLHLIALPHRDEVFSWLATQPITGLRKLCLRTEEPLGAKADIILPALKIGLEFFSETLEYILLGFHKVYPRFPVPDIAAAYYYRATGGFDAFTMSTSGRVAAYLLPVFRENRWPRLQSLEFEGVENYEEVWEPLRVVVPRLHLDYKKRGMVECWDPKAVNKL